MPRDRHSSQSTFDISLLDSQALDTPEGLAIALRAIETICYRGDPGIAGMVTILNNRSYLLEYIISGTLHVTAGRCMLPALMLLHLVLEEGAYKKLSKWIITGFPTSAAQNMMDTMSMELLQRFSSSLLSVEDLSTTEAPHDLHGLRRKVELLFNVLKHLRENFSNASTSRETSNRKKGKAVIKNRRVDRLPFDSVGMTMPTTDAGVRDVYSVVLSQLRGILEVSVFATSGLRVGLNCPSITCSFSGNHHYRRLLGPRTSM